MKTTILASVLIAMTTSIWAENLNLNFRSLSKGVADAKVKTERISWKSEKPPRSYSGPLGKPFKK